MSPDLGKYAATVLSAYGLTILLLGIVIWISLRASLRARNALNAAEARRKDG